MSSSMVERVAMAIARADMGSTQPTLGDDDFTLCSHDIALARAAIQAMREPNEGMIEAQQMLCVYRDEVSQKEDTENLRAAWQAMIDGALYPLPAPFTSPGGGDA